MLTNSLAILANTPMQTVATLFSCPSIGLPCSSKVNTFLNNGSASSKVLSWFINSGLFRGMPIYCESYKETGDVQIGRQMLLNGKDGGVSAITDNLVVLPRKFSLKGYLSGQQFANLTAKASSTLEGLVGGFTNDVIIQLAKQYIRFIREGRVPFWFTTREGERLRCLIEKYDFEDKPEAENACVVALEITQFVAMTLSDDGADAKIDGNLPTVGSIFATPATILSCVATVFASIGAVAGALSASGYDTVDAVTYDDSYVNAEGKEEDVSAVKITDDAVLNSVCDSSKISANQLRAMLNKAYWNTCYVVDSPFADMASLDENGETTYKEHVDVSVDFDDNTLSLTLRRDQLLKDNWWVTEEGSVDGEIISTNDRVVFNTFIHSTWKYGIMFVSRYLPVDGSVLWSDLSDLQKLDALATCSLVIGSA